MVDFKELAETTILSQYSKSPVINQLVDVAKEAINPQTDIDLLYNNIVNPKTAIGAGLDYWGRIVGVGRYVVVDEDYWFGFLGQILQNFDHAPFYKEGATRVYRLEDPAYRRLIFVKAKSNISDCCLPDIKAMLRTLFLSDDILAIRVHVYNESIMKLRIVFGWNIDTYAIAILKQYGLLNIGCGVDIECYIIDRSETFGFDGSKLQPFDQGIFAPYTPQPIEDI